jgi:hypothetical protein
MIFLDVVETAKLPLTVGWTLVMLWFINPIFNAQDEQTVWKLGKTLFLIGAAAALLDFLSPGIFYRIDYVLIAAFTIGMEVIAGARICQLRNEDNPFC